MMHITRKYLFTVLPVMMVVQFLTAQTGPAIFLEKTIQYVPGEVPLVVSFNLDQLNKKVSLEELKQYDFYQSLLKELGGEEKNEAEKVYVKKFLETPSALGYNLLQPFHFFMLQENELTFYALILKMGDREKYESGLASYKLDNYLPNLTDHGDYQYWSHNEETFAWNEEVIINIWVEKASTYDGFDGIGEGGFDWEDLPAEDEEGAPDDLPRSAPDDDGDDFPGSLGDDENGESALAEFAKKIMRKSFPSYITTNHTYKKAVTTTSCDVHFWMDYDYLLDALKNGNNNGMMGGDMAMVMEGMTGMMDVFYSDTYLSAGLNFQNGKIALSWDMYMNQDMKRFYQGALDGKFNRKFLRYVKGDDPLFGYYYFNINVKNSIDEGKALMHKALLATPQYGQLADDAMKILGIFIDEKAIADLWKGDFLFSVAGKKMMELEQRIYEYDDDFNFIEKDTTVVKEMPVVTMLASYGNEKDIMKFVDLGVHAEVLLKEKGYYKLVIPDLGMNAYLAFKKGVMILTNDKNLIVNKLNKGYKGKQRLAKKHRKLMGKNASVLFWDVPTTLYAMDSETAPGADPFSGYFDFFARQFKSVEMRSDKTVDDAVKNQLDFNFINQGENSLEQFFNFMNDIYLELMGGARI